MPYRECELGLLVRLQPENAAKLIVRAFKKTRRGNGRAVERAAQHLEVSPSSLKRYVRALEERGVNVREEIAALAA